MNRRRFFGLAGAAAAWPLSLQAQHQVPLIGYLGSTGPDEPRHAAFRRGLADHGFIDGQNVRIEYLCADSRYERLPSLVAEFQRRGTAVIFASGNQAALAAKAANLAIPVVFMIGDDPVRLELADKPQQADRKRHRLLLLLGRAASNLPKLERRRGRSGGRLNISMPGRRISLRPPLARSSSAGRAVLSMPLTRS